MNIDRIVKNIEVNANDCWIWKKSTNSAGYGQLTEDKKYWLAHRYALSCVTEVLPTDVVRHSCHIPKCCNPAHLSVGTHADNYADSREAHNRASEKQRSIWSVSGVYYPTLMEAHRITKVHVQTLLKYTKSGVFDIEAYRNGCKKANVSPRI